MTSTLDALRARDQRIRELCKAYMTSSVIRNSALLDDLTDAIEETP